MATETGEVTDELIKMYTKLAKGDVGLIIPGYMFVHHRCRGMKYQTGTYGIGTIDLTALRLGLQLLSLCRDQHIHFDLLGL